MLRNRLILLFALAGFSFYAQIHWTTTPLEVTNGVTPKLGTLNSYGVQIVTNDTTRVEINQRGHANINPHCS